MYKIETIGVTILATWPFVTVFLVMKIRDFALFSKFWCISTSLTNRAMHFVQIQWRGWPLKNVPPHICYHADFGSSTSRGVGISRGDPKLVSVGTRPLGWGVDDHKEQPIPTCYLAEFGRSRSNGTSVIIMEICLKKVWPLVTRLSRSLTVIGTDTIPMTFC